MTLISNKTERPFITSDNPVIFYNQFLERRKVFGGITGLACKGLEILLPLSPSACLLFYDRDVYDVANGANYVDAQPRDVTAINVLQFISADENIYFNEKVTIKDIVEIEAVGTKHRHTVRTHVDEYVGPTDARGRQSILHTYKQEIRCGLSLSFVGLLPSAKGYKLGSKAVHVRDKEILQLHQEFVYLVEHGFYRGSQFPQFMTRMSLERDFFYRIGVLTQ